MASSLIIRKVSTFSYQRHMRHEIIATNAERVHALTGPPALVIKNYLSIYVRIVHRIDETMRCADKLIVRPIEVLPLVRAYLRPSS